MTCNGTTWTPRRWAHPASRSDEDGDNHHREVAAVVGGVGGLTRDVHEFEVPRDRSAPERPSSAFTTAGAESASSRNVASTTSGATERRSRTLPLICAAASEGFNEQRGINARPAGVENRRLVPTHLRRMARTATVMATALPLLHRPAVLGRTDVDRLAYGVDEFHDARDRDVQTGSGQAGT